jgi:hypothetical protein
VANVYVLGPPRKVILWIKYKRKRNMNNATLSWKASLSGNPTAYQVTWGYNGVAQPVQNVPRTAGQDASGYSLDFASANPTITVKPTDVIGASIVAYDAVNNISSAVITPPTVTIPTPPGDPQNVLLVLS